MTPTLRHAVKSAFTWLQLPVLSGPLRGRWWIASSGSRFIRGTYGADEVQTFLDLIRPGDVVYDVGAHVGYYTVMAADRVGPAGQVAAFEPLPLNLKFLRTHLRRNRVRNVEVVPACVGRAAGQARFDPGPGTGRGRLAGQGGLAVEVVALDALVASGRLRPPTLIKMDVEGAEAEALEGAREILRRDRPALLLSVHGEAQHRRCGELLSGLGYRIEEFSRNEWRVHPPAA
ncbi:MAG TPA: FkbM family methyltransferase [Nevskiaceae bacterium]|nr:FkbM family methyltransferase [Nevskiaceae bacterium]